MTKSDWKDTAELLGIAAILVSLVFVGIQLKQSEVIASSELNVSLVAIGVETANLINNNAEIWVNGSTGAELNSVETAIFNNIVANLDTRWFVEHRHATRLGENDQAETIMDDWSAFLHQHPGARKSWAARQQNLTRSRDLLNPDGDKFNYWSDAIQSDLRKLDQAGE